MLAGAHLEDTKRLPLRLAMAMLDAAVATVPSVRAFIQGTMDADERPLAVLPVGEARSKGAFDGGGLE